MYVIVQVIKFNPHAFFSNLVTCACNNKMADEMELVRGCCYVGCYCPWCAHLKDSFCLRDILELNVKVHNRLCKVVLLM